MVKPISTFNKCHLWTFNLLTCSYFTHVYLLINDNQCMVFVKSNLSNSTHFQFSSYYDIILLKIIIIILKKYFLKNPKIARFWPTLFSWFMKTMHWMFISSGKSYEIVQCLVLLLISLILKSVFNWCSAICFQLFELSYC